ncbi:hypothetical protein H8356DRAFT_1301818 [Neocallimastix lanati (nom. inval.)]|nr:hypothetical protein H8356DRAFT_1301818 [Neocallimastix sp. JGI-2020a]
MNEKFKEIESYIDLSIFHIKNRKKNKNSRKNRSDYEVRQETLKKQEKFRRTVLATKVIVSQKLYKAYSNSLEKYFNDKWKLSRAQVYRFLDCAKIIEKLSDFELQPCNERVCRSLNKLTKNTKYMRILWREVLKSINNDIQLVNSVLVEKIYKDLISRNIIPSDTSLLKVDDSEEQNESTNVIITKSSSNSISPNSNSLIFSPPLNNNDLLRVESSHNSCINSPNCTLSEIKDQKSSNTDNSPISLAIASQPKTQSNHQIYSFKKNF